MINKFPVFLVLLLLPACAVHGPLDDQADIAAWQQRQALLLTLTDWSFDGRLVIHDGRTSVKSALHWQQQKGGFDIRLMSFFGQQWARLQGVTDGPVRLLRPGRPPQQAFSAAVLMKQELGWVLPLEGLRYWVVGVPVPGRAADWAVDAQGRLKWLEQDGWRVEFTAYQWVEGQYMPRKMRLKQASLSARLVLDRWQLNNAGLGGDSLPSAKPRLIGGSQ